MRLRSTAFCLALGVLAACAAPVADRPAISKTPQAQRVPTAQQSEDIRLTARTAVRNFVEVVQTVEPVAERACRDRAPRGTNCDFRIVVDDTPNAPPNAFQTVDDAGRPLIAFTIPLIAQSRNRDELAFILAHEAAHHILGHLQRQRQNATVGAVVFGQLAGVIGSGNPDAVQAAQEFGATLGARSYSKDFELEADAMGTIITSQSGFDPILGAEFFFRIPDPGNRFLGTHPANADRVRVVRETAAGLRG